jgi:hypothetical protein
MRLVDTQGQALRTFNHHGSTFVLGDMGRRYGIQLVNHSAQRVEVVVSVDGRDVVHGERSGGSSDRGYIVPAFGSTTIRGFRTSMNEVAAFRFTTPGDSFSGRNGTPQNVGIIRALVFREQVQQMPRPRPMKRPRGMKDKSAVPRPGARVPGSTGKSASETRSADRHDRGMGDRVRRRTNNLGTQFGERTMSRVREVSFSRATPRRPNQMLAVRYDDRQGLVARGIRLFTEPPPMRGPLVGTTDGWRRRPPPRRRFAQPPPSR